MPLLRRSSLVDGESRGRPRSPLSSTLQRSTIPALRCKSSRIAVALGPLPNLSSLEETASKESACRLFLVLELTYSGCAHGIDRRMWRDMSFHDELCLSLGWGLLLAAGACGGNAVDTGGPVGAAPPVTSQGGSSGVATSVATGSVANTGGFTTAGGASLGTGGVSVCRVVYGNTPYTSLVSPELCGNGVVEASSGEQCDDGNLLPSDGCSSTCYVEPLWVCPINCGTCQRLSVCGDGIIEAGEVCDDGNTVSADDCAADCLRVLPGPCHGTHCNEPGNCGDGIRQVGESCDLGSHNDDSQYGGCSTKCLLNAYCGDGEVQGAELCDLGENNHDDVCGGCSTQCVPHPFCGDSFVQAACGEICDDGVNSGVPGSCSTDCKTPFCGDGIIEPEIGEECDVGGEDGFARPYPHCALCKNVWMY